MEFKEDLPVSISHEIYQIIVSFDDFIVPKKVKNLNDHFGPNMSPI